MNIFAITFISFAFVASGTCLAKLLTKYSFLYLYIFISSLYHLYILIYSLHLIAAASACESPKVTATSYTPVDAQALTHIPFIAEFSLTCKGVAPTGDVPIYANVEGAMIQVARSKDGSKYQVGWSTEMKKAKTGDYEIR